jgi:hypothetical protein
MRKSGMRLHSLASCGRKKLVIGSNLSQGNLNPEESSPKANAAEP